MNRLMLRVEVVSALARRLGRLIVCVTRSHLKNIDLRSGIGDLWGRSLRISPENAPLAEDLKDDYAAYQQMVDIINPLSDRLPVIISLS